MFELFDESSQECSRFITQQYSTSFSLGIKTLHKKFQAPIYGIYAFVRLVDEIVDTFHDFDKQYLLAKFKSDTLEAIHQKISLNPVLFSFQKVVHQYQIPMHLVDSFFKSMEMDLVKSDYGRDTYDEYIYGSAEVVGLMCLKVFSEGDEQIFESLKSPAKFLGAAFQKVNFLRDMQSDFDERGRVYFPGIDFANFKEPAKKQIEAEIEQDFEAALKGILLLPNGARAGVYLAYKYYVLLFKKIKMSSPDRLKESRIRVNDMQKFFVLISTLLSTKTQKLFYSK